MLYSNIAPPTCLSITCCGITRFFFLLFFPCFTPRAHRIHVDAQTKERTKATRTKKKCCRKCWFMYWNKLATSHFVSRYTLEFFRAPCDYKFKILQITILPWRAHGFIYFVFLFYLIFWWGGLAAARIVLDQQPPLLRAQLPSSMINCYLLQF